MAEFGTLADWEELLDGLHARGMRLVMDLVVTVLLLGPSEALRGYLPCQRGSRLPRKAPMPSLAPR